MLILLLIKKKCTIAKKFKAKTNEVKPDPIQTGW